MNRTGAVRTVGFVGIGHMGEPMARRLVDAGWDTTVHSRTAAKADAIVAAGARRANSLADLRSCDLVYTMLRTDDDLRSVALGPDGLLAGAETPGVLVDCSTVSPEVSTEVDGAARRADSELLAAPVAGGPAVIAGGHLAMVCSGTRDTFDWALPVLRTVAPHVIYAGEGSASRLVKILHNLVVATLVHSLAEVSVLAEALGIRRQDLLDFIDAGAMGSAFIRYKSAAMNDLDFRPAFTGELMLKDVELGLDLARNNAVTLELSDLTRSSIASMIAGGRGQLDIAALLVHLADLNDVHLHDLPAEA